MQLTERSSPIPIPSAVTEQPMFSQSVFVLFFCLIFSTDCRVPDYHPFSNILPFWEEPRHYIAWVCAQVGELLWIPSPIQRRPCPWPQVHLLYHVSLLRFSQKRERYIFFLASSRWQIISLSQSLLFSIWKMGGLESMVDACGAENLGLGVHRANQGPSMRQIHGLKVTGGGTKRCKTQVSLRSSLLWGSADLHVQEKGSWRRWN